MKKVKCVGILFLGHSRSRTKMLQLTEINAIKTVIFAITLTPTCSKTLRNTFWIEKKQYYEFTTSSIVNSTLTLSLRINYFSQNTNKNFIRLKCVEKVRLLKFAKFLLVLHRRCSVKKGVLKIFAKFTGKHMYQSLFFNKVAGFRSATLLKKRLWQRCFLVNFSKFLRTPFLQNTSGRLLLFIQHSSWVKAIKLLQAQHFTIFLTEKTKQMRSPGTTNVCFFCGNR